MDSRTCLAAAIMVLGVWPLLKPAPADDPVVAESQRLCDSSKGDSRAEAGKVVVGGQTVAVQDGRIVLGNIAPPQTGPQVRRGGKGGRS